MKGLKSAVRRASLLLILCGLLLGACQVEGPPEVENSSAVVKNFGAEPLTLRLRLDRGHLSIAEQLTVELRAETPEDYAVKFDEVAEFPGFAVVSEKESSPELTGEGRVAVTKRFLLDPLVPGSVQIAAFTVDAWQKAKNEATPVTVTTEPLTVEIASLLAKDDKGDALSDIAPPVEKPISPWLWVGIVLAGVILTLVCWYFWQRSRRKNTVLPPPLPPHLIAYQALDRLVKGNLLAEGQVAAFYQALSDIVRHYIEQRFGLRAPERTTEEFLAELSGVGAGPMANPAHKSLLRDFLIHCDLVKFACYTPALSEAEEAVELCRRFVRETEPSQADSAVGEAA